MRSPGVRAVLAAAVLPLLLLTSVSGCGSGGGHVTGSGVPTTKQYDLSDFTGVSVGNDCSATITRGSPFSVVVSADDNLVKYLRVDVQGGVLHIGLAPDITYFNKTVKAKITLPQLASVDLGGGSDAQVSGFASTGPLALTQSGATLLHLTDVRAGVTTVAVSGGSTLEGGLVAREVDAKASGASDVKLTGSAEKAKIEGSGASEYVLNEMPARLVDVQLSGASKASVCVTGILTADLSGASVVDYYGRGVLGPVNVNGASQVNHIGG